jgi:D-amino peptidase
MKKGFTFLMACIVAAALPLGAIEARPGLKVYISADMEGIWGVVHANQTSPDSPEYAAARKWMAEDVNAVVAGLFDAGATEVIVNDSHGSQRNIIAGDLDPRASLISGSPKPLSMMEGIDASCQACLFIGYHAMAGTGTAILDHTISGSVVRAVKINGREMPELGINAGIAGYFGVPVIMVSGDTAACAQAKSILGPETVTVPVKDAVGRYAARMVPRDEARRALRDRAKQALLKRASMKPFKVAPPVQFDLLCNTSGQAEAGLLLAGVTFSDARTLSFSADDYVRGFKLLRALIALASDR